MDFASGYVQRSLHLLPKQGARAPWRLRQNYLRDVLTIRRGGDRGRGAAVLAGRTAATGVGMSAIAATPEPPYVAVIFTSLRTEGDHGYARDVRADGRARRAAAGLPRHRDRPGRARDHGVLLGRRGRRAGLEAGRGAPRRAASAGGTCGTPTTGSGSRWCSGTTARLADAGRLVEPLQQVVRPWLARPPAARLRAERGSAPSPEPATAHLVVPSAN